MTAAEALAGIQHSQNRITKKRTRTCGKKEQWQRRGHAFGPHLRWQKFLDKDGWSRTRSIDMPCCQKGEKYIMQALSGNIHCRSANVSVGLTREGTRVRVTLQSLPDPALACSCLHVDLYATGLLHRFTTARQRETCARQLSHAGGQPRDSARQPRDSRETARDSARQPRDSRESYVNLCNKPVAYRSCRARAECPTDRDALDARASVAGQRGSGSR